MLYASLLLSMGLWRNIVNMFILPKCAMTTEPLLMVVYIVREGAQILRGDPRWSRLGAGKIHDSSKLPQVFKF